MNPNFRRMPSDANAIRRNYLANLALQISNNQKNWNANQIFQTTGVTPTEPSDPRSRTDIAANVEDMKVQLRQALASKITDWANANVVVDRLDGDEVRDMLQMLPQIATALLPSNKSGVPADVLLTWFARHNHLRGMSALDGLDLSQRVGMQTESNTRDIYTSMATTEQVERILKLLSDRFGAGAISGYGGGGGGGGSGMSGRGMYHVSEAEADDAMEQAQQAQTPEEGALVVESLQSDSLARELSMSNEQEHAVAILSSGGFGADWADPEMGTAGGGRSSGASKYVDDGIDEEVRVVGTPRSSAGASGYVDDDIDMEEEASHMDVDHEYEDAMEELARVTGDALSAISSSGSSNVDYSPTLNVGPLGMNQPRPAIAASPFDMRTPYATPKTLSGDLPMRKVAQVSRSTETPHYIVSDTDTPFDRAPGGALGVKTPGGKPPRIPVRGSEEGGARLKEAVEDTKKVGKSRAKSVVFSDIESTPVGASAFGRASMSPDILRLSENNRFTPIREGAHRALDTFRAETAQETEDVRKLIRACTEKLGQLEALKSKIDPDAKVAARAVALKNDISAIQTAVKAKVKSVKEDAIEFGQSAHKESSLSAAQRIGIKTTGLLTKEHLSILDNDAVAIKLEAESVLKHIMDRRKSSTGWTAAESQAIEDDRRSKGKKVSRGSKGIRGFGLDTSPPPPQGVPASQPYVGMGKHFIHKHKLIHDGILQIRRKSGTTINHLPTQKISKHLATVLLKLIGNDHPSFEDMQKLADNDRALMNKIIKNTKIDDRLMLPTPERTEEEQEWNRFQVLVGETHAGNNSPELIKELKGLLLKMAHTNRLPKGQVREILMDLTAMGH